MELGLKELLVLAALAFIVWKLLNPGDDQEPSDNVEVRPEPMDDLPDNAAVYVDGARIGQITPNPKQGDWSASTSKRAVHGMDSRESAIAAVMREHYGD